jgi:hypothetical protein
VDASGDRLRLSLSVRVDYRETEVAGDDAELDALSDDLLPDWDDDWVMVERERYRQTRLPPSPAIRLLVAGLLGRPVDNG